jgi:hypothetical protein
MVLKMFRKCVRFPDSWGGGWRGFPFFAACFMTSPKKHCRAGIWEGDLVWGRCLYVRQKNKTPLHHVLTNFDNGTGPQSVSPLLLFQSTKGTSPRTQVERPNFKQTNLTKSNKPKSRANGQKVGQTQYPFDPSHILGTPG